MTPHDVAFEVAHEIVESAKREGWDRQAVAEQAIRTALAILTEGITAGPIEGIAQVKIKPNTDGSRYLAVYFAGPIRAAGGTEAAQTVMVADAVRQLLDLDRYKPSPDIVERYVEEVALYNRVSHLQYPSNPEEVRLAARNVPVEVTGEPTAEVEVTGYRDLPGVETNRLRGGAILVLNDSILGKAHKLAKLVKEMEFPGWDWLERLSPRRQTDTVVEQRIQPRTKFLEDIIAGRPVLAYPSRKGGFRIRYGRARNTGLSALGVHPATMVVLDNFVACGTQLIVERPGKGCVAMPVDSIHGPVVKLRNGSIRRIDTIGEAKRVANDVARVLFLGDLLIGFGEFRENNHLLVPAGYCPEWWSKEVERALQQADSSVCTALYQCVTPEELASILKDPLRLDPNPQQALAISSALGVPLHPRYIYFWENLSVQQLLDFQSWLRALSVKYDGNRVVELRGAIPPAIQAILEELRLPCEVDGADVSLTEAAPILYEMFRGEKRLSAIEAKDDAPDALTALQKHWHIQLRSKGTFYVGARVGRPEKAKRREMSPPPHGIFPVGFAGGATRDILKAAEKSLVNVEANLRACPRCARTSMFAACPDCATPTVGVNWCVTCRRISKSALCEQCHGPTVAFGPVELSLKKELRRVRDLLGGRLPDRVKGVKGLTSKRKIPELLEKAVLRAKHNLYVYKDGTIRFDMTDAPLTHFRPSEIQTSCDKLKTLGYEADVSGAPLVDSEQLLELRTQDIVIPRDCGEYLFQVSCFLDELLSSVYGLQPFYRLSSPDDLVGHLVVGLAPHTSAGVIGRIIGFTTLRVCYAHPFWHAAKRRNCDGDEDTVMLALDPMINFSREFLPSSRGGTMDAPVVLSVTITPKEVDDEAHNIDVSSAYPLEFYERALQFADPRDVEEAFDLVAHRISPDDRHAAECQGFRFSHPTGSINQGPRATTYTTLKTMREKVDRQLALAKRITAVDADDMARRLLDSHFLPDIFGNIRAFSIQTVRCTGCNAKFRRAPLGGVCPRCAGKLVLTVTKAGITKYIEMAQRIAQDYGVPLYHKQRLELACRIIDSLFTSSKVDKLQTKLGAFGPRKAEGA
jgi:DNA polymerase II large subunit